MTKIDVHVNDLEPDPEDTRELPGVRSVEVVINPENLWYLAGLCALAAFVLWMYPWGQAIVMIGILFGLGLLAVLAGYAIKLRLEKRQ